MSAHSSPSPNGGWRRIEMMTGETVHGGWWRALGEQVHLESEYGNANGRIDSDQPEHVAADLFMALIKRHRRDAAKGES